MLYSMTGFGRAEGDLNGRQVSAEIKTLNGKQFEITSKLPYLLRPYEAEIRGTLSGLLLRGTTDVSISIRQDGGARQMAVNVDLAVYYYQSVKEIARRLQLPEEQMLPTLMSLPEIVTAEQEALPADEWLQVKELMLSAAGRLMEHRRHEGAFLEQDLLQRIGNIESLQQEILPLEAQRTERVRQRLRQSLRELGAEIADENRFEQELIYYLEKMDFSEEKSRLAQHCVYFREMVAKEDKSKGKILGFILQEVGREINTLGAKANDATIQQLVVRMKDELEKAKEQVLNVL